MTIDECVSRATVVMDEAYALALEQAIEKLNRHGEPTQQELETFVQWYEKMLQADRTDKVAKLRSFLERDGSQLQ